MPRRPETYGDGVLRWVVFGVAASWAIIGATYVPADMWAKMGQFMAGALAVFLIAGLTCWAALSALAAVVGEREGEG